MPLCTASAVFPCLLLKTAVFHLRSLSSFWGPAQVSNQAVPVTPDGLGSRQNGELEQMLSASEVALRLQLSPKTIYSYAKRGLIPHRRIQTNLLFVESELADLFKAGKLKGRKQNDDNQQPDHSPELPVEIQT